MSQTSIHTFLVISSYETLYYSHSIRYNNQNANNYKHKSNTSKEGQILTRDRLHDFEVDYSAVSENHSGNFSYCEQSY